MAAGLVVIASNHIGPKEIIQNGTNGFLVKEKDPDAVIDIITDLTNNWDKYMQILDNATKYVQKFNRVSIAQQWSDIINS